MKKILASLLTTIFVGSTTTSIISCNTEKSKKEEEPIKKREITESNLDQFFKVHNTFEYKGEFFFKENESVEEIKRINLKMSRDIFSYIINQTLGIEFNKHFMYIPHEYTFILWNPNDYKGIRFNEQNNYEFNVKIISANKNIKNYISKRLTLKFTETKQYDKKKWLQEYLDYFVKSNNLIWGTKYENYAGSVIYTPSVKYNEDSEITSYFNKNQPDVLKNISDYYTNVFTDVNDDKVIIRWFYDNTKMKVVANKYEYLGEFPKQYEGDSNKGIRAKVHLVFSYLDNSEKEEVDVEIWIKLIKTNLGGE